MELREDIIEFKLLKITKTGQSIKLKFFNPKKNKNMQLAYDGFLFETPSIMFYDKSVKKTFYSKNLGFKAITQLRHFNYNVEEYYQLLIVLDGSTDDFKQELTCVFKNYSIQQL